MQRIKAFESAAETRSISLRQIMKEKRRIKMICEVIRGLISAVRIAEKAEECAKRSGFACDRMPCFKDRDDEEEARGCDRAPCRRDRDDDEEEGRGCDRAPCRRGRDDEEEGKGCDRAPCRRDRDDDDEDEEDEEDQDEVVDVKAEAAEEEKKEPEKVEPVKKPAPAKADLKT